VRKNNQLLFGEWNTLDHIYMAGNSRYQVITSLQCGSWTLKTRDRDYWGGGQS
jgi:hypothetical protein